MIKEEFKLDNPIWYALSETHKEYAVEFNGCKFYKPEYSPFGWVGAVSNESLAIEQYSKLTSSFYMVGDPPEISKNTKVIIQLNGHQMITYKPLEVEIKESIVELKFEFQKKELFDLVNLVQPWFIRKKIAEMGTYFGIYSDGNLIAASGERIQMNSYCEVSAVVTHPDFRNRGYAKQLLKRTPDKIFADNKIPILHVDQRNLYAIKLYEQLGFITRKIGFCLLETI